MVSVFRSNIWFPAVLYVTLWRRYKERVTSIFVFFSFSESSDICMPNALLLGTPGFFYFFAKND